MLVLLLNLWTWPNFIESEQDTDAHSYQPHGCHRLRFPERNVGSEINDKLLRVAASIPLIILSSPNYVKLPLGTLTILRVSTDLKFNEQPVVRHPKSYTHRNQQEKWSLALS